MRWAILAVALTAASPAYSQCIGAGVSWKNISFAPQNSAFSATFDAIPGRAKMDGVTGLSNGPARGFSSLAAIVRFNNAGTIDARKGGVYAASVVIPYTPGLTYHFRITVDPAAHVYSVYVTPPGGVEQTLASGFAFRVEQARTSTLDNWAAYADAGTHQVCNFALTGAAPPPVVPPPTVSIAAPAAGATLSGTALVSGTAAGGAGVAAVAASVDGAAYVPCSGTNVWTCSLNTAGLVNGGHMITVQAKDSSGQAGTASVAVLVGNVAPPMGACIKAGLAWQNTALARQGAAFSASFDAIPGMAKMDGVTGFSNGPASGFSSLAVIVRFNNAGFIDARNGASYAAAAAIPYAPGLKYHFRLAVDPAARVYSVYVTPPGGVERTLASGFAFRTEQARVSSLDNWAAYADAGTHQVCDFALTAAAPAPSPAPVPSSAYNQAVLNDHPVMFLAMDTPSSGAQADLSGNGNNGTYQGGTPTPVAMPNGDPAAGFNGFSQYLTVRASPALSVPASGVITIESWIRPDTLQFPNQESTGYVYWLGKGNPTDGYEYANRMYSLSNSENRPNRISIYAWNTSGGLGSGAYFQDPVNATDWIMVTDVINMRDKSSAYPTGYISIYKNGVLRGKVPLNQYSVVPATTSSPFNVGTRNATSWFKGAVGKVAVYNYELSPAQIAAHYAAMR